MVKIYRIAGTAALAALFIARGALAGDETPKRPQTSAPVSSSLLSVHASDVTFQLQVSHWMWLVCSGRCRICAIQWCRSLDCGLGFPRPFEDAVKEASIGRVRPKIMTASTAILGLLPLLVLRLHGTEIEKPLAIVMVGGLITSTLFTLLALPTFYIFVHRAKRRLFATETRAVIRP